MISQIEWNSPEAFWLLLALPAWWLILYWRKSKHLDKRLLFSSVELLQIKGSGWREFLRFLPSVLLGFSLILAVIALARPQLENVTVERNAEGIDIVLSLDISTSMRAEDLKPNRLEAARNVATDFVSKRISDRIGLVAFARQSYTACPPTLDYNLLSNVIGEIQMGQIQDGTAIGMGIATAVNRLKDSNASSKVIILLTDGMNNAGEIDPVTAAELALNYQIRIYTIGVGSRGTAPYPVVDPIFGKRYQSVSVDIDEEMLTQIAEMTGGTYFRATDTETLQNIYDQIDELERTEIEEIYYTDYEDLYEPFLILSLVSLLLGMILDAFWLRSPLFSV